jgi:tetratricopeptide (TPR) repeat protein
LESRVANALVSYGSYIGKMIWPHRLAVFYPYPDVLVLWQAAGAGLLLGCVSLLVILAARRRPYLLVGWLWYVGTLVPVIGLVQVGEQAMADRYTYVPLIGLFIMIAVGIPDLLSGWRYRRIVVAISAGLLLSILMIVTWLQLRYWKNGVTLFEHSLEVTANNSLSQFSLGIALADQGKTQEAIVHYAEALRIKPDNVEAHYNLGVTLAQQGKNQEAIAHFTKALEIKPDHANARNNLGVILASQGKTQEAIAHYTEALRIDPNNAYAHNNLGLVLAQQGKNQEAIVHYTEALRIEPDYAEVHNNLGVALAQQGRSQEAIGHFAQALRIKPEYAEARFSLGLAYLMMGNRTSALEEYEILKTINPGLANTLYRQIIK